MLVDAIEPDETIFAARGILEANGVENLVTLYRGYFEDFHTEQLYDVVLSDLRGALPFFGNNLSVTIAARRLLAAGGTLIPSADRVYVAPCSSAAIYRPYSEPWKSPLHGVDLSFCQPAILRRLSVVHADEQSLLCAPALWANIDYQTVETPDHSAQLSWTVSAPGSLTGYLAWFESTLAPGVHLSNRPGSQQLVYGQLFFPLAEPTLVASGATIRLVLGAALSSANEYRWDWATTIEDAGAVTSFGQSTHRQHSPED